MKNPTFFSELSARLGSESPKFFKKLKTFGNYLSGVGVALTGIPAAIDEITSAHMDLSLLVKISSYLVLSGLLISTMAKMPVADDVEDIAIKKD